MQTSLLAFETELERLLDEFLGKGSFGKVCLSGIQSDKKSDPVSNKINNLYREQLDININNYIERVKIDRTITFSEKKLHPEKFNRFLLKLGHLCISGGRLTLAIEIFRKSNLGSDEDFIKAESFLGFAEIYSRRADLVRCFNFIGDAKTLYQKINMTEGLAKCENLLGTVYGELGNIEIAREHFLRGISLINPQANAELSAKIESNLGVLENIKGNYPDAIRHLNKAVGIYRKLGFKKNEAEVNLNIGLAYLESGMTDTAMTIFDEGILLAKEEQFMPVLCLYYQAKAQALVATGSLLYAEEFTDKALELSHYLDDKLTLADLYKVKGILERNLKNFHNAEDYLLDSLRINTSLRNEMNIAETSYELGILYKEIDNQNSKQSYLKTALNYFREIRATDKVKQIENLLATGSA